MGIAGACRQSRRRHPALCNSPRLRKACAGATSTRRCARSRNNPRRTRSVRPPSDIVRRTSDGPTPPGPEQWDLFGLHTSAYTIRRASAQRDGPGARVVGVIAGQADRVVSTRERQCQDRPRRRQRLTEHCGDLVTQQLLAGKSTPRMTVCIYHFSPWVRSTEKQGQITYISFHDRHILAECCRLPSKLTKILEYCHRTDPDPASVTP
jgi:hypothetical protein